MAVTVAQAKTGAINTPTTPVELTLDQPATAGNLLLVLTGTDNVVNGRPAGYTLSAGASQVNFMEFAAVWKVATGGETSTSFTMPAAATGAWVFVELAGLTATPYDTSLGGHLGSGLGYTSPTVTPTAGQRLVVACIGHTDDEPLSGTSGWTDSFAEVADAVNVLGSGTRDGVAVAVREVAADGVTDYSTAVTFGGTTADTRYGIMFSFRVAESSGGADVAGSANLAGTSAVHATGSVAVHAATSLSASGGVAAAGSVSTPDAPQVFGQASLAAGSTLTAAGKTDARGSAALAGGSTLTAVGRADVRGAVALAASSTLTPAAHLAQYAAASLAAGSGLSTRALSGATVQVTPPFTVTLAPTTTSVTTADTRTRVAT